MMRDSSDNLFIAVWLFIAVIVTGNCCISCRSVNKVTAGRDSTVTASQDSAAVEFEILKRRIDFLCQNFKITLHNISLSRDSTGKEEEKHQIIEMSANTTSNSQSDDATIFSETVCAKKDSASATVKQTEEQKIRSPPLYLKILFLILCVIILYSIYKYIRLAKKLIIHK